MPSPESQPATALGLPAAQAEAAAKLNLYGALIVATLLWGSLPVASRALVGLVTPAQQALVRGVSAFVVLTLFSLLVSGRRPLRAALNRPIDLIAQGFLSFFASSLTSLMSLQYISASLQSVLLATYPVMLAVGTAIEGGLSTRTVIGTLIALLGIVAVVGGDDPTQIGFGDADPRGVALALVTAAIIAGSQRWGQRQVRRNDPLAVTGLAAGAAIPLLVATVFAQGGVQEILVASTQSLLLLLYLGVFCTAINFGLWYWALKIVSATQAAPIQYLSTPASVLLAWYFLDERLTLGLAIGTVLVLGGVSLSQSRRRRSRGIKDA